MSFLDNNRHSDFINVFELLYPRITILSNETSNKVWDIFEAQILPLTQNCSSDAQVQSGREEDILSALNKLFTYTHDKTVYVFWNNALQPVIKTELEAAVKNMNFLSRVHDDLWLWSPISGYVVTIRHSYNFIMSRIPKYPDPFLRTSFKKNVPFVLGLHKHHPFRDFLRSYELELLSREENNRVTNFFENTFPFTPWGKIDWENIICKKTISASPKITSSLENLAGGHVRKNVYIIWPDSSVPVVRANLDTIIEKFDILTLVSSETFIINPTSRYVVEIDLLGKITAGILPPKNGLYKDLLQKKQGWFNTYFKGSKGTIQEDPYDA